MQLYQPGPRSQNRLCPPDDCTKSGESAIGKSRKVVLAIEKRKRRVIVQMALGVLTVSAAEEHELSNPEVPSGQRNKERGRGSLGWWGTLPRSMFCVKAGSR